MDEALLAAFVALTLVAVELGKVALRALQARNGNAPEARLSRHILQALQGHPAPPSVDVVKDKLDESLAELAKQQERTADLLQQLLADRDSDGSGPR